MSIPQFVDIDGVASTYHVLFLAHLKAQGKMKTVDLLVNILSLTLLLHSRIHC